MARTRGDARAEAEALVTLAEATPLVTSTVERVFWWVSEAQDLLAQAPPGDPLLLRGLARLADALAMVGESALLGDVARELLATVGRTGDAGMAARARALLARSQLREGAAAEALASLEAETSGPSALLSPSPPPRLRLARAEALFALDRFEDAVAALAVTPPAAPGDSAPAAIDSRDTTDGVEAELLRGEAALLAGNLVAAEQALERVVQAASALEAPHEALVAMAWLAVLAASEGRHVAATDGLAQLTRAARELDPVWTDGEPTRGHPLMCLAGVRSPDAAAARLRSTALERGRAGDARGFAACTLVLATWVGLVRGASAAAEILTPVSAALVHEDRRRIAAALDRLASGLATASRP